MKRRRRRGEEQGGGIEEEKGGGGEGEGEKGCKEGGKEKRRRWKRSRTARGAQW